MAPDCLDLSVQLYITVSMLLQLFQHSAFAAIIFVRVMQQACQLLVQQKHHAACSSCACRVPAAP
jgi:hypothetical protein